MPFCFYLPFTVTCLIMHFNLRSLTHEPLVWKDIFPPAFKGWRLPGGKLISSVGEFGTVCIQEYKTDHYSIRLNVFDIIQRFIARSFPGETGLYTKLVLKGRVELGMEKEKTYTLGQNQFILHYDAGHGTFGIYPNKLHISLETSFSPKLVNELNALFPGLDKKSRDDVPERSVYWADVETLEIVHSLLHCKYEKELRRYYFDSRVRDLLFKYLLLSEADSPAEKAESEDELKAIYQAEEIISQDISMHTAIPDLSKKVLLNEFRLKKLFKKVFGMGPYEYLVRKRLQKAKELLESGHSVKEAASQVGYRPSDFTTAFREYFGFTPSSIKKRNS
jgi:AraC-type DNA-binding domain-containing proteins